MSVLSEIRDKVRNAIHDGESPIKTIPCKGYANIELPVMDRHRCKQVARWVLDNRRSAVSGPMEFHLESMTTPGLDKSYKPKEEFLLSVRQTLAEFDPLVPC